MVRCAANNFWVNKLTASKRFDLRWLKISGSTNILESQINCPSDFEEAVLGGTSGGAGQGVRYAADITGTVFQSANFTKCKFPNETRIGRRTGQPPSRFEGEVKFDGAKFGSESFGALMMTECLFQDSASFKNVEAFGGISLNGAVFERGVDFSNLRVKTAAYQPEHQYDPLDYPAAEFTVRQAQFRSSLNLDLKVEGSALVDDIAYGGVAGVLLINSTSTVEIKKLRLESFTVLVVSSGQLVSADRVHMQGGGELRVSGPKFELTNFTCTLPVTASNPGRQSADDRGTKLTTLAGTHCDGLLCRVSTTVRRVPRGNEARFINSQRRVHSALDQWVMARKKTRSFGRGCRQGTQAFRQNARLLE